MTSAGIAGRLGAVSKKARRSKQQQPETFARPAPQLSPEAPPPWWTRFPWLLPALLAILCLALYARSLPYPLADFDDDIYLFQDPRLLKLSWRSLGRILTDPFFANYHPITTLTYAFDTLVWGTWLPGFRATHLLLYAGGVVLLFYMYRALLKHDGWSFAAAALFATHTTHVEVVAWLAQRKDVVCLAFYAACLTVYIAYTRGARPSWRLYLAALALALLACLSKGYAVILPGVLLAYDATLGGRMGRRQLWDKLPFVLIALGVTRLTVAAQDQAHALIDLQLSLGQRLLLLGEVFAGYVGKVLLPVHLSSMYLVNTRTIGGAGAALGLFLGIALLVAFFALRRRAPLVAFALALFALPLATVMNVFFTLRVWIADRYLFFPTIGACLAIVAVARQLHQRRPGARRRTVPMTLAFAALVLAALTVVRIGVWHSPVELWSDAARKSADVPGSGLVTAAQIDAMPRSARPSQNYLAVLATAYARQGNAAEAHGLIADIPNREGNELSLASSALDHGEFDKAASLARKVAERGDSDSPEAWQLIAQASERKGDVAGTHAALEKAIEAFTIHRRSALPSLLKLAKLDLDAGKAASAKQWALRAIEAAPSSDPHGQLLLAHALEQSGEIDQAYRLSREILAMEGRDKLTVPFDFAEAHVLAGVIAERLNNKAEALAELERGLTGTKDPRQQIDLRLKIGLLAEHQGDNAKAVASLQEVLRLAPDHKEKANILLRLGVAAENLGHTREAQDFLEGVLAAAPEHPERADIHLKLGQLAEKLGDRERAIRNYQTALAIAPTHPSAAAVRARIEVLQRQGIAGAGK